MSEMVDRLGRIGLTRGKARVAILELAKPTAAMLRRGAAVAIELRGANRETVAVEIWAAMCDEALAD